MTKVGHGSCRDSRTPRLTTGLPLTPRAFNAIVTFVDRLSKRAIFVPATSSIDAKGYADLFYKENF